MRLCVQGKTLASIKPVYDELLRAWKQGASSRPWPGRGGESPDEVRSRGMDALRSSGLLHGRIRGGRGDASGDMGDGSDGAGYLGDSGDCGGEQADSGNCSEDDGGGRHVCMVTHSRFNKILIAALRGDVSGATEVSQGNACVNVIDFPVDGGPCLMTSLNVCDHL